MGLACYTDTDTYLRSEATAMKRGKSVSLPSPPSQTGEKFEEAIKNAGDYQASSHFTPYAALENVE